MSPATTSTIGDQKSKSWFSALFSHWHPISKWTLSTNNNKHHENSLNSPPSSLPSSPPLPTTISPSSSSSSTHNTLSPSSRHLLSWQLEDRQERRQSQQTIGSVFSDDQFSSSSCHGRDSEEKSRLGDLWSKARKRHPHYPRFRWPHRHHHHQSTTNNHPLHRHPSSSYQHRQAVPISIYSTPPQDERPTLANSYQETYPRRPSSLMPSSTPPSVMIKRHSITSLISGNGDLYYNSRPGSILYSTTTSQPDSPRILFMKDGQLWDDNNEDVDDYFLDNNNNNSQQYDLLPTHLHRWTLKHDLLKLALNGSISCPLEENGGSDKQVLQIGCGDGTWCIDVAMANPKWTVIGMEENGYDHYMTTANESDDTTCFGSLSHGNGLFKPRNMRLIRCAPSLLHALQQMPDHVFDLVDGRCLILGYSFETYRQLIKECWRVCKIGGYVELIEMDMRMYHSKIPKTMGKTIQTLNSEVIHMMESRSLDPRLARRLPDILEEIIMESISTSSTTSSTSSNAVHITSAKYTSLPIGVWGGRLGVMFREDLHTLMESVQVWISQYKESDCRSDQDLEKELDQMDNEMELQRSFMNLHHCYAQKTC